MSKQLEQILDLLLAEDNAKAEELLHEYVVAKARAEYERVLDESEEEEIEESEEDELEESFGDSEELEDDEDAIDMEELGEEEDEESDFESDIEADDEDFGDEEGDDDFDVEMDDEEGEDDVEDKVDELEAELADLKAEFEALLAAEAGEDHGDEMDMDMDMGDEMGDEEMMDSVEYDLEEATQFSKATGEQPMKSAHTLKGGEAESSSNPNMPKPSTVGKPGQPIKAKDGSAGKEAAKKAAKHDATHHNMGVQPGKAAKPSDASYQ